MLDSFDYLQFVKGEDDAFIRLVEYLRDVTGILLEEFEVAHKEIIIH
jgi:hypothetical protein